MNTRDHSIRAWKDAHYQIRGTSSVLTIPKTVGFPHPRDAGALPTTTWPVGQIADYLLETELGGVPLLIREFADRYEAFLTGARLAAQLFEYVKANPTAGTFVSGALLGAVVGAALTKKSEGALAGAALGLVVAAFVSAITKKEQQFS